MHKTEINSKILHHLKEKHDKSGGHCGIYFPKLAILMGMPYSEIRESLKELYASKEITARKGINGWLLFIKKPSEEGLAQNG